MPASLLEQILEANRSYLAGTSRALEPGDPPFVVVTCVDARLTGLLEQALGLPRRRALVVRTAGSRVAADSHDALRSVVAAVFVNGAAEILVVGHTDCAMAAFLTAQVVESFRQAGIPRSAFGDLDLRAWFGATGSVREGVVESVTCLRGCALLPRGFPVHGLIIDSESGRLEHVIDTATLTAGTVPVAAVGPASSPALPERGHPAAPSPPPAAPRPPVSPVVPTQTPAAGSPAVKAPDSLIDAARMLAAIMQRERANPHFQQELVELRAAVGSERNPLRLISLLERTASRYQTRHPELPQIVAFLKRALVSREAREKGQDDIVEQFQRILR
jgi:carbonic anhydrase